jgi:hypothetical protein
MLATVHSMDSKRKFLVCGGSKSLASAAWLLLIAAGCASEQTDGGDEATDTPAQTSQPAGGTQTANAGRPASSGTMTGSAGTRASGSAGRSGSGATGETSTAGSAASAAGSSAAAGGAGAGGSAGGDAGSGGAAAAGQGGSEAAAGAGGGGEGGAAAAGTGGSAGGAAGSAGSAGAAGSAGTAGSAGAAGAAGSTATEEREDLGEGDGSDVVLIGDSWMSNTLQVIGTGGGIAPSMLRASGQRYANYGVQGTMLLEANAFGPAIPSQWDQAKRRSSEIKTVVMTAGGNDVIQGSSTLQASCQMGTDECKQKLVTISNALNELWTQLAADGVQDVVHIRYTDNTGTLHESLRGDKGLPTPEICLSGKIRCHGVPTTDLVAASDLADGIHPVGSANDRIAKRTYELMVSEGMRR